MSFTELRWFPFPASLKAVCTAVPTPRNLTHRFRRRWVLGTTLAIACLWLSAGAMQAQTGNASPTGISPTSGSNWFQSFTVTVQDANGGSDVQAVDLYIMTGIVPGNAGWSAHSCVVQYNLTSGVINLAQDAGGAYLATPATAGTPQTVSNSQCTVLAGGFSLTKRSSR